MEQHYDVVMVINPSLNPSHFKLQIINQKRLKMATIRKTLIRSFLRQTPSFSPRCLSTAVRQSGRSHLLDKVKADNSESSIVDILNEHKDQGIEMKRFDVVSLKNFLRDRKNYKSALEMFEWIERNKLEITNADQAIRIDLLYKTADLASAEKYFDSLQDSEKTNKTYGALLSCYCREKALDKALDIFEKMKVLNYTSALNYNNLLSLYCSIKQPEKVVSLVQEMEEKDIPLSIHTYNLLINSYAALKNLDAIEEVLAKMKSNHVKFDVFTYGNLASICVNAGLPEKANAYLEMMEKTKNLPRREVFEASGTLLKLYSDMNNLSGVNRSWEFLKSAFPKPNNTGYLLMLLALSKLGNLEELEKLFKEWEEGCSSIFDFRLPNVLLEFYLKRDMIEKATSLYETLANKGIEPNLRALNLFAALCMKNNEIDLALKYLEMGIQKAASKNQDWFPTDDTLKLFLNYFEEKKDDDRVERFVQSAKKVSRLDSTVYESLLSNTESV